MTAGQTSGVRAAVLTVSDTRTPETDTSGRLVLDRLRSAGHQVINRDIVRDDLDAVRQRLEVWIADPGIEVIIATGGTGITPRDVTPEALAPLVTKPIAGFGELLRWLSYQEIGTSCIHSRAEAALCRETLVFLLPGSEGACRTAMDRILIPQLDPLHRPCNFTAMLRRGRAG